MRQITTIKTELSRVRTLIRNHERQGRESVEQHLQELRVKREDLENLKSENSQLVQDNNVVEVIRGRKERLNQLESASMSYDSGMSLPDLESLRGMYRPLTISHCQIMNTSLF